MWLTFGLLIFFSASIYALAPVLTPFVTGLVVAYLLDPMVEKLDKYGVSRSVSSTLPVVIFFTVLIGGFGVLLPTLAEDAKGFIVKLPELAKWLENYLTNESTLIAQLNAFGVQLTVADVQEKLTSYAGQIAGVVIGAAKSTAVGALAIIDLLSFLILTPLVVFYILLDWPKIIKSFKEALPLSFKSTVLDLLSQIDKKLSALVRGQLLVAITLGLFYGICLSISGLQLGFLIGLLTGILSIIPMFGFLIGLVVAFIMAVLQYQFIGAEPYLILAAIFAAGQVLESFYLTPKLLGNKVGLHPIWVIFALLAGGHILGLLGMLIALPVAIVVQVLLPFFFKKWAKQVDESGKKAEKK